MSLLPTSTLRPSLARAALRVVPFAIALALALQMPAAASAELHATPSTLKAVFASAQGGDTVYLGSGDYGSFAGGAKPSAVTLAPEPGATPTLSVDFSAASHIRLDGLTLTGIDLHGTTHDVTIANSNVTDVSLVDTTAPMVNANIVFDGDRFANINVCPSGCYEGRLTIHGTMSETQPIGVTIKNSVFGPGGSADGIMVGAYGVQILNNEFRDLTQGDPNVAHTDAIQFYGQQHTVVDGNYFHNTADGIMSPDGGQHDQITNNVFDLRGTYPYSIMLGGDHSSVIKHNTLVDGSCSFNLRCGIVILGADHYNTPSVGTVIRDNVMGSYSISNSTSIDADYNLLASGSPRGAHDIKGSASFVGGSNPSTFAGFRLVAGSRGTRAADDGADMGILPSARAESGGAAPAAAALTTPPAVTLRSPRPGTRFNSKLRLAASARDDHGVKRVEFWLDGHRRATDARAPYRSTYRVPRRTRYGVHTVTARAVAKDGQVSSQAVTVWRVRRLAGRARAVRTSAWRATTVTRADGTALRGRGTRRRRVAVSLARCGDRSARIVVRLRLRASRTGLVTAAAPTGGLCIVRLQPA